MPNTTKINSEELVNDVKETAKKATKKAASTAKEVAKKADSMTAEAKKSVSKAVAVKPIKEEVYLQYLGKEVSKDELMKRVKEIWTKQMKRKVGEMKTVALYLKPEENKVYFVVNGEESGSLDI